MNRWDKVAKVVRERRAELDWTREQATAAAGISRQTWYQVERGEPVSERTLRKVSRAMGADPGMLAAVASSKPPHWWSVEDTPDPLGVVLDRFDERLKRLEDAQSAPPQPPER